MQTCPKCNMSGIPDDAKFCPKCGQRVTVFEAELKASRTTIRKFQTTTISWKCEAAKKVRLDGEILTCPGSKQVNPHGDHKYTIDFLDAEGKSTGSRTIIIEVTANWSILVISILIYILAMVGVIVAIV